MSRLPTKDDISVFGSLDEGAAVSHFLGLDIAAATALLIKNPIYYFEDMMWMGPKAFSYYCKSGIQCLQTGLKQGDDEALFPFIAAVEFQVDHYHDAIRSTFDGIRECLISIDPKILDLEVGPTRVPNLLRKMGFTPN